MKTESRGRRRLASWLKEHGYGSSARLAHWLGVHTTVISFWKTGVKRPVAFFREALETVTGIESDAWLTDDELSTLGTITKTAREAGVPDS